MLPGVRIQVQLQTGLPFRYSVKSPWPNRIGKDLALIPTTYSRIYLYNTIVRVRGLGLVVRVRRGFGERWEPPQVFFIIQKHVIIIVAMSS